MKPGDKFNPWGKVRVQLAIMQHKSLSDGAKLAWIALELFCGAGGLCNPSMARLAERMGRSDRRARSAVSELEKQQFIRREETRGGYKKTSRFVFLWHADFGEEETETETRTEASAFEVINPDGSVRLFPETRTQMVEKPGRKRPPNTTDKATRRIAAQETRRVRDASRAYAVCEVIRETRGLPPLPRGENYPGRDRQNAKALASTPDADIVGTVRMMMADTFWAKNINPATVHRKLADYRQLQASIDKPSERQPEAWKGDRV